MCAPHATTPITIELTREEWADCRQAFDDLPPANDGPGVHALFAAWDRLGVPDGR